MRLMFTFLATVALLALGVTIIKLALALAGSVGLFLLFLALVRAAHRGSRPRGAALGAPLRLTG
mgnify:CR=1 FL=1